MSVNAPKLGDSVVSLDAYRQRKRDTQLVVLETTHEPARLNYLARCRTVVSNNITAWIMAAVALIVLAVGVYYAAGLVLSRDYAARYPSIPFVEHLKKI